MEVLHNMLKWSWERDKVSLQDTCIFGTVLQIKSLPVVVSVHQLPSHDKLLNCPQKSQKSHTSWGSPCSMGVFCLAIACNPCSGKLQAKHLYLGTWDGTKHWESGGVCENLCNSPVWHLMGLWDGTGHWVLWGNSWDSPTCPVLEQYIPEEFCTIQWESWNS